VLSLGTLCAADSVFQRAQAKIGLIEDDLARPGSRIWISTEELNAYARVAAVENVPRGLREPRVILGHGTAVGSAWIDLVKVLELKGQTLNPLVAWLLSGDRQVIGSASVQTGRGQATILLHEVTISGVTAKGAVLQLLVDNFLLPLFPDVKIGQPFPLKHNMERFEISPQGVNVIIRGPAPKK
jgi:hypothetical protein